MHILVNKYIENPKKMKQLSLGPYDNHPLVTILFVFIFIFFFFEFTPTCHHSIASSKVQTVTPNV